MILRHLLFFSVMFCLSSCFRAYIPEPTLDQVNLSSDSAVIAFSIHSSKKSGGNTNRSSQFIGRSLGHQFLFPGIPVTSLYFERDIDQVFGEYLLNHPKFGRGDRAITNLSPSELTQFFGSRATAFTVDTESFSASGHDYFFMRKAVTGGRVNISVNNSPPETLEFSSSRFISKATVEVISELVEEGLFNALESSSFRKALVEGSDLKLPITAIICVSEKQPTTESCLSKKNVSIGVENYFKNANLKFVSFRGRCPERLPSGGLLLTVNISEIVNENGEIKVASRFSMIELRSDGESVHLIQSKVDEKAGKFDASSSEPECTAVQKISEDLARDFAQND